MKNLILDPVVARLQFAARFSYEDWSWLCTFEKFNQAVQAVELGVAEVIAHEKFAERDAVSPETLAEMDDRFHRQQENNILIREFVTLWANQLGRNGKAWKQSRQNHIRRLMKHGLGSDYAMKMRMQAGI